MDDNTGTSQLSILEREALLQSHALFALLTPNDIHELALLVNERSIHPGSILVTEGDLVDSVYFIVSGTAEVTRTIVRVDRTEVMHIAQLTPGDVIGLAGAGFFSPSGVRKATVTAENTMVLLKLSLKDFNVFLKNPELTYPALKNISEKLTLMSFLKDTEPFKNLPNEKIKQLAHHVTRCTIKAGNAVFPAEEADACYVLLSGKITLTTNEGSKSLESPALLAGVPFIDHKQQDVSAIAETDCELFMLSKQDLLQLMPPYKKCSSFFHVIVNWMKTRWI